MRRNRRKTHKLTDFNSNPLLLHVVISSVIGFDNFFYPVVMYTYYLICIFMIFYANLKNDGNIIEKKQFSNDQDLEPCG